MRTKQFLVGIVLGVIVAAYAEAQELTIVPTLPHIGSPLYEVRVTPSSPTASNEVSVAVCGWKPAGNYQIYDTDLRIEGAAIWLDLYWHVSGIGVQAFLTYEHTVPLGTLDPGTYIVYVANHGALGGSGTTAFTVSDVADDPDPAPADPDPIDLLDPFGWLADRTTPTINLPGFEIEHVAISDVGGAKDGISQLRITPTSPKSSDEVSVTVSGWRPRSDLKVEWTTLRTVGNEIWLDLYWLPRESGTMAVGTSLAQEAVQTVTIIQLDVTAYYGVPFAYTESLGTFSPGTYSLHVTNHSPMTGSASILFTVLPSAGPSERPSWWQSFLQGIQ